VDYAKMMAKMSELPLSLIEDAIRDLMEAGLVERDSGSAIKRSKARFKKAFEVHKHHTYYRLSREGELFVRRIDERWLKEYLNSLIPNGWNVIRVLKESSNFEEVCRKLNERDCDRIIEELIVYYFITPSGKKTTFFKLLMSFLAI
jgi:predicted transcriptional regulator